MPQTHGGVQDYRALREPPEDLKSRLEHERTEGSKERIGAGSNRSAGVPGALKKHSSGRTGEDSSETPRAQGGGVRAAVDATAGEVPAFSWPLPQYAAHHGNREAALVRSYEFEDPAGVETVSQANQAATLARISRRSFRSSSRSGVVRPS